MHVNRRSYSKLHGQSYRVGAQQQLTEQSQMSSRASYVHSAKQPYNAMLYNSELSNITKLTVTIESINAIIITKVYVSVERNTGMFFPADSRHLIVALTT